jgi:hypothetical protein
MNPLRLQLFLKAYRAPQRRIGGAGGFIRELEAAGFTGTPREQTSSERASEKQFAAAAGGGR